MQWLLGGESGVEWNQTDKTPDAEKEFALPDANPDMRRVFAYLIKQRFIDREVLSGSPMKSSSMRISSIIMLCLSAG